MTDLLLYHALHSTCSQKVRFTLAAKQIGYDGYVVDLAAHEQLSPWYLGLNPNGVVPTLAHGDAVITDSSVICEYLDEVFGGTALSPTDPVGRARMRAWMRYFEEVPTVAIRAPSIHSLFFSRAAAGATPRVRPVQPLRKYFYAKLGPDGFPQELIDQSLEQLASCLDRVEKELTAAGPWLLGDALTLADIVLLPTIVRLEDLGHTAMWDALPAFTRWYAAMRAHSAFGATYVPGARITA